MTEKHMFADVSLPLHVWVREGHRWVLRDASAQLGDPPSSPGEQPNAQAGRKDRRSSRR